ncbi:hypothetical protein V1512DRAFT_271310 [Lipomyces arxii]|uniref:uncharacterized protein n=1 Tax=Lipomyces arxii TaxID=56418 RepID=UPI0034CD45FF
MAASQQNKAQIALELTEENLRALLQSIGDRQHALSTSRSSSRSRPENTSDILSLEASDATEILPGIRRIPSISSTIDSTPQGSVVNLSARRAAVRLTSDRKPVQGTRHRRRLENAQMLYNPHAVPPSPADFLPTPTYAIRRIDKSFSEYLVTMSSKVFEDFMFLQDTDRQKVVDKRPHIPKTLKDRVKKGHLTQPYLKGIEEDIRKFVLSAPAAEISHLPNEIRRATYYAAISRTPQRLSSPAFQAAETKANQFLLEKEIEIDPDSEKAESFSRWIVYQIAEYYQVSCYTKIAGERRIPCVVLNVDGKPFEEVPRPIWTYV